MPVINGEAIESLEVARERDRAGRRIRVLVLVKASPQPSTTYGETVCVAGIAVSPGPPRWVRLYPVPFQLMDGNSQFTKYQTIDVAVRDAGGDKRVESLKIDAESLRGKEHLKSWADRAPWVEPMVGPTMCEVGRRVAADMNSVSLAAIRPRVAKTLVFERHPGWTATEQKRLRDFTSQGDLLGTVAPRVLEAPRMKVTLHYYCEDAECSNGHRQRNIDWELTAFQNRYRSESDEKLQALIRGNFFDQMFTADRRPLILVGNQENVQRRRSFTVLGVYWPRRTDVTQTAPLF